MFSNKTENGSSVSIINAVDFLHSTLLSLRTTPPEPHCKLVCSLVSLGSQVNRASRREIPRALAPNRTTVSPVNPNRGTKSEADPLTAASHKGISSDPSVCELRWRLESRIEADHRP